MMVGVSGSGKTTISKTILKDENAIRISSDDIRLDLINKGTLDKDTAFTPEGNAIVFQIMRNRAKELVQRGKDILLDAQHIKVTNRKPVFDILGEFDCYYIAHVVIIDKDECERRHKQRDLVNPFYPFPVPQRKTMDDRFAMFEMPTEQEGFDEIRLHFNSDVKK